MKTSDYLDLAQKKTGKRNDNQLSELLGWSRSKVNNYRHNRQHMDNEAARQIAELIDVPVITVIADMEAQRIKNPEGKKAWKMIAKMTAQRGFASTNLLLLLSFFSWTVKYCILCKIDDVTTYA